MIRSGESGAANARRTEEEQGRRQAAYVFVGVYVLFMLTVIVLMAFASHDLGLGWV